MGDYFNKYTKDENLPLVVQSVAPVKIPHRFRLPRFINSINFISFILFLYSIIFLLFTIIPMYLVLTINSQLGLRVSPNMLIILQNLPLMGLLPFLPLIFSIYFLYLTFKVRDKSRKSILSSAISCLIGPYFFYIAIVVLISLSIKIIGFSLILPLIYTLTRVLVSKESGSNLLIFIPLILFLLSFFIYAFRKYNSSSKPLSKRIRMIFMSISSLLFISLFILVGYLYFLGFHVDGGYTETQNKVNFHIYKPTKIPGNGFNVIQFNDSLHKMFTTEALYYLPFTESKSLESINPTLIFLLESPKNDESWLKDIITKYQSQSYLPPSDSFAYIPLANAKNYQAFMPDPSFRPQRLYFETNDGVYIEIVVYSSRKISVSNESLIQFAESLR